MKLFVSDCECNLEGSVDNFCDHIGQCVCNDHVTGEKCSACSSGFDLFPACDNCATEFYGFPNCRGKKIKYFFSQMKWHIFQKIYKKIPDCQCNMDGSVDNVCDVIDGKCTCKEHVAGHNCDKSEDGWWNFPNPEGMIYF